jgi:hypothetical protein
MLALRYPDEIDTFSGFSGLAQATYQDDGVPELIEILWDGANEACNAHNPLAPRRTHRYLSMARAFEVQKVGTAPKEHEACRQAFVDARSQSVWCVASPRGRFQ